MFLLIFESIGAPELMVILVVALIIFGPRKLPQLSRSLGRSLNEFRRASDEFKRTWEREVEMEATEKDQRISQVLHPEDNSILGAGPERTRAVEDAAAVELAPHASTEPLAATIPADSTTPSEHDAPPTLPVDAPTSDQPTSKRDWL